MSVTKKSQFALALFSLFAAVCYGQQMAVENIADRQNISEKPHTISIETDKTISSLVASDNEKRLFVSDKDGLVYSFDLETYEQMWMTDLGGKTSSNVLESGNSIYIVTSPDGPATAKANNSTLWAIDGVSGITFKKVSVDGGGNFFLYKTGKYIYAGNNSSVSVWDENLENSAQNYSFGKEKFVKSLFDSRMQELFLVFENEVIKLSYNNEKLVADKIIPKMKKAINTFAFSDDLFFIGDVSGGLYAFKKSDKNPAWQFRAGGKISDIKVFGDRLVVSSYDNFLYCFGWTDGERFWKKRFPGRISEIIKSDENSLFVKSMYFDDFYNLRADTGDISGQFKVPSDIGTEIINLQTTSRLIMFSKTFSIDIYKKN